MIADRRYLAAQVEELQQKLDELSDWVDNPDTSFPGDALALAALMAGVVSLMLAEDVPARPLGGRDVAISPADPESRLRDALERLTGHDDQWRVTPSPGCLTVTRAWPDGSADTLIVLSPDSAYGVREDARERKVWSVRGTVEQITEAARDLAAPFAPGAPTEPVPEYQRDDLG